MKQFITVLLAVALLFSLGACSNGEVPGDNGNNDNNGSDIAEPDGETPAFSTQDAFRLEQEFLDRLIQETADEGEVRNGDTAEPIKVFNEVRDFNSKEEMVIHLSVIMDRNLAVNYVDEFYEEEQGNLYLIPRDGPITLLEDEPYNLEEISDSRYRIMQEVDSEFIGLYTLLITYRYSEEEQSWIIEDREVQTEI